MAVCGVASLMSAGSSMWNKGSSRFQRQNDCRGTEQTSCGFILINIFFTVNANAVISVGILTEQHWDSFIHSGFGDDRPLIPSHFVIFI